MAAIRLLVALLFLPLRIFMALLGLVLVPIGIWRYDHTGRWPALLTPWGNFEHPLWGLPFWYTDRYAPTHWAAKRFPRFWWLAGRNPANNMRRWFKQPGSFGQRGWAGPVDPRSAREHSKRLLWRYRWSGLLGELWVIYVWNDEYHFRFRLGWKLGQADEAGSDYLGYAIQLMPRRVG